MESQDFYKQDTLPNLTKNQEGPPSLHLEKIGPYKVDTLLSKGGMSYLYLALHPEGFPIAIKVLLPKYMASPEMVQRFLKESEIIGLTNHPNIIKLYGQGRWEKGLYIAMEFVQGISLKQFIRQQTLSTRSSLEIILQVAYALLHLHTHGVIHRDLKPENILITESGQVKVIDFGIAQLQVEKEEPSSLYKGQLLGTPSYMSPEQRKNPLQVTIATDIYSLGVITFELLFGKLSYGFVQLSLLPKHLRKIVEKATEPAIEERYQDIVDMILDVSNVLKDLSKEEKKKLPSRDLKEIWTSIEQGWKKLLPPSLPKCNSFEIGCFPPRFHEILGIYYDFFRFADGSYLLFFAKVNDDLLESLGEMGLLKGMVQSLVEGAKRSSTSPFHLFPFITELSTLLASQTYKVSYSFYTLHLSPSENCFSFISCSSQLLLHLTQGSGGLHLLHSDNPLLGKDPYHTFYETRENWGRGDSLILYPFSSLEEKERRKVETSFFTLLPPLRDLSVQPQAEKIASSLQMLFPSFPPPFILTIHRLI